MNERCHFEELDADERILKWISKKHRDMVWAIFIWLRLEAKTNKTGTKNKGAETAYPVQRLATGWVVVPVPVGARILSFPRCPDRLWDQTSLPSNGYRGVLCLGVKWPGREAHHSPPASAEVKKMWIYTTAPPYAFMA
jgi:hypothetical protein